MVEGGGSKSYNHARAWFYKWPAESHVLLSLLTDVIIEYLTLQVVAGAQMLEVFDSWAGDLSPDVFNEFSLPYLKKIASGVKANLRARGIEPVPMTVFPKGAHFAIQDYSSSSSSSSPSCSFIDSEYDVVSIDWSMYPSSALRSSLGRLSAQGNLDVSVLYADSSTIRSRVRTMIDGFGPQRLIANLGHGMLPDHPVEGLVTFIDEVHTYSEALIKQEQGKQI
jgi:uroporphyrinogen decarboxylase